MHYADVVTIAGPYAPASVVLDLSIHGSASSSGLFSLGVRNWVDRSGISHGEYGRLDLYADYVDATGNSTGGRSIDGIGQDVVHNELNGLADGSTSTGSFAVPWAQFAHGNSLLFELTLVSFGRAYNWSDAVADQSFSLDRDYWAQVDGIRVIDDTGADVTAFDHTTLASNALSAAPEPATFVLTGSGLAALALLGHRRRRQSSNGWQGNRRSEPIVR